MTLSDAIILIDAELASAGHDVTDPWRVVRGFLRRRERPSQVGIPAVEPITTKHFAAAKAILDEAGAEVNRKP